MAARKREVTWRVSIVGSVWRMYNVYTIYIYMSYIDHTAERRDFREGGLAPLPVPGMFVWSRGHRLRGVIRRARDRMADAFRRDVFM